MMNGMWSKSSKRFADRMEKNVIMLGLGLGASLFSALSSAPKVSSASYSALPSPTPTEKKGMAKISRTVCIVLLVLAPVFQVLSYVSYACWGWWAFFSLLIFSTLALFFLGGACAESTDIRRLGFHQYKLVTVIAIIETCLFIVFNLWPVFVWNSEISGFSYFLMGTLIVFAIALIYYTRKDYKENLAKEELATKHASALSQPPTSKRTSRTIRINDMEERFNRVNTALAKLEQAEKQLFDLTDDIDALREYQESGKWKRDCQAEKEGKLPVDLKKDVLTDNRLIEILDEIESRL